MMFKNDFRMALRTFSKRRLYGIINLLGLSVAITFCLLTFLFVNDERSYDKFHKNGDRIFALYRTDFKTDDTQTEAGFWDTSPKPGIVKGLSQNLPFLKLIEDRVPEIEHLVRSEFNGTVIRKDGKDISEAVRYVDQSFLDVFSFNLLYGDRESALAALDNVVITEEIAIKHFGQSNAVGETLKLGSNQSYTVSGVVEKPKNSSISLNILLPIQNSNYFKQNQDNWGYSAAVAFIYVKEGVNPDIVKQKINEIYIERFPERIKGQREALNLSADNPVVEFNLINIQDMYLDPTVRFGKTSAPLYSYMILAVALLVLLIASVNYISISVASANSRSLEVTVRKVVGASKMQLKRQFYIESFLLTTLALIIGYTLMQVLLPVFNELSGKTITLSPKINQIIVLLAVGLNALFGFIVGGYPAQVLSRIKIASGLRGGNTYKINPVLIKGMIVFQFAICILLISVGLTMNRQFDYISNKDLGFNKEQVVYLENAWGKTEQLKQELLGEPSIANAFGAGGFFAAGQSRSTLVSKNVEHTMVRVFIDHDFFESMQIEFLSGRSFDPELKTDKDNSIIVNEKLYNIISNDTLFSNFTDKIIGVVKDFHYQPLSEEITPMQFSLEDPKFLSVLYARLEAGQVENGIAILEKAWDKIAPNQVMEMNFLDEYLANNYKDKKKWSKIINISSIVAVVIACIGLFGLTAINSMNRTKEIGIRKVLGAGLSSLLILLNRQIFWLIIVALMIAVPVSYYIIERWLAAFAYHIDFNYTLFLFSGGICLSVVILTVMYHSLKSSRINPAELLRDE